MTKLKISQQVANILQASMAARNSDKELLLIYLQKSGMALSEGQIQLFRKLPSMETLRRIRQKLQQQGSYPASSAVETARYQKYKQVRANIIDESPDKLLEQQTMLSTPRGIK